MLSAFSAERPRLSLSELAARVELPKATESLFPEPDAPAKRVEPGTPRRIPKLTKR